MARAAQAREGAAAPVPSGRPARRVAVGDPQAPLEKLLTILDLHGLLSEDGWLSPEVQLVSMGDHFDWGGPADRDRAAEDGLLLLHWLAAHAPGQVILLVGNHDLARVGELISFDDATWTRARAEADRVAQDGGAGSAAEASFLARYPMLPSAGVASRDFASFTTAQRDLVADCLNERRFRLAHPVAPDVLLTHAGVTQDDLDRVNVAGDAEHIAKGLNDALDTAIERRERQGGPLAIPGLHEPGNARTGEARGILFHRPSNPEVEDVSSSESTLGRRFDPRRLPAGLIQGIGHIRDSKCRKLLGGWARQEPEADGPIRTLTVRQGAVDYVRGVRAPRDAQVASMLFLDGGMLHADVASYELLDLDALEPA